MANLKPYDPFEQIRTDATKVVTFVVNPAALRNAGYACEGLAGSSFARVRCQTRPCHVAAGHGKAHFTGLRPAAVKMSFAWVNVCSRFTWSTNFVPFCGDG